MMPSLRPAKLIILPLLAATFLTSLVLFIHIPTDSPSSGKEFARDVSDKIFKNFSPGRSKNVLLNIVEQDNGQGMKFPTGIVYKHGDHAHSDVDVNSTQDSAVPVIRLGNSEDNEQWNIPSNYSGRKSLPRRAPSILSHAPLLVNQKIKEMSDQLIMAKAYLHIFPKNSNPRLVRELKLRIKEMGRILSRTNKDSSLSKSDLHKMRTMSDTLSRINKAYPDCYAMASRLRAELYSSEKQLRAEQNQASYYMQLAARTYPKGLHCLSMRLTADFFSMQTGDRVLPNSGNVHNLDLFHYAIFSDNVLACGVVVNSTISSAVEKEKHVFHVITDSLNFPAMVMWFLLNPVSPATIQIQRLEDLSLPADFSSKFMQPAARDPRYTSSLNHLRFYLPKIFPSLDKILLLDYDVVVQRDLSSLWSVDMKGKINGAVQTCKEGMLYPKLSELLNFSAPAIAAVLDRNTCMWAFGVNMFDLQAWRRKGLMEMYDKWHNLGKSGQLWKAGSLPLGQLIFYDHTMFLDQQWHVFGLGRDSSVGKIEIEKASVIHYDGKMKPWLDIALPKYKGYWSKFLDYNNLYLQQCNIHE